MISWRSIVPIVEPPFVVWTRSSIRSSGVAVGIALLFAAMPTAGLAIPGNNDDDAFEDSIDPDDDGDGIDDVYDAEPFKPGPYPSPTPFSTHPTPLPKVPDIIAPDQDSDRDGIANNMDPDDDNDGIMDDRDSAPFDRDPLPIEAPDIIAPNQDSDRDGIANNMDPDDDNDGIEDDEDQDPFAPGPFPTESPDIIAPDQDNDGDGIPNNMDPDDDNDGIPDDRDAGPFVPGEPTETPPPVLGRPPAPDPSARGSGGPIQVSSREPLDRPYIRRSDRPVITELPAAGSSRAGGDSGAIQPSVAIPAGLVVLGVLALQFRKLRIGR